MTRWRPSLPSSTALITRAGLQALQQELDTLWRVRRPAVVKALSAAAAEGDRSENAEYQYRKKELAGIDRRVRYLSKRIPTLKTGPERPQREDCIYFGALVTAHDAANDRQHQWRIVGPDETDARRGCISIDSPLARALLGRTLNDEVEVEVPAGAQCLRIQSISYPQSS
ncbi:MAG: transcription elongation factor GreB [Rhodanobacteraceae bacterium]